MSVKKAGSTTPRKPSDRTSRGKKKVEFLGYVNWTLTEGYKQAFLEWLQSNPDVDDMVEKLLEESYSLKFRYDNYNQCLSASLYCVDSDSPNAGWTLSMRSGSWIKALERLLFVHYVAFDGVWVTEKEEGWAEENW